MKVIRLIGKLIICILTLPLLLAVVLAKWSVVFLHCCSAWVFYIFSSVLFATAVLSFFMGQSSGGEAVGMLIVGFMIFMVPYVIGFLVATLELLAAAIRGLWYI